VHSVQFTAYLRNVPSRGTGGGVTWPEPGSSPSAAVAALATPDIECNGAITGASDLGTKSVNRPFRWYAMTKSVSVRYRLHVGVYS
jgi:hypothetical protein